MENKEIKCSRDLMTSFSNKIRLEANKSENLLEDLGSYTITQTPVKNNYISAGTLLKKVNELIITNVKEDCNQLDMIGEKFEALDHSNAGGIRNGN